MKYFLFIATIFLLVIKARAQNVGIGTTTPLQKLHVEGTTFLNGNVGVGDSTPAFPISFGPAFGDKISLLSNSTNSYGFGIQSGLLQIHTEASGADIAFGYGSSNSLTERARIINYGTDGMMLNGRLHIKNGSTPLDLNATGGVWLYKSDNSAPLGFMGTQNLKNIGFYGGPVNNGWGFVYDAINSRVGIGTSNPLQTLHVEGTTFLNGNVGIGNSNPGYKLDINNRMRIRSGGNNSVSAGLWLNNNANAETAFIGMEDDTHVGFLGIGTGWKFGMNTQTGALKINGTEGQAGQVLTSAGGASSYWGYTNSHYIGESYGGGIVFYVYDNGQHGLIAATTDQSLGIPWENGSFRYTGTTGDGVPAGSMNTALIVATQMVANQPGNFAAKVCADYSLTVGGVTYGDWYLPSRIELDILYLQKTVVGGFANNNYWSSREVNDVLAWKQDFATGFISGTSKSFVYNVRAIRAF